MRRYRIGLRTSYYDVHEVDAETEEDAIREARERPAPFGEFSECEAEVLAVADIDYQEVTE